MNLKKIVTALKSLILYIAVNENLSIFMVFISLVLTLAMAIIPLFIPALYNFGFDYLSLRLFAIIVVVTSMPVGYLMFYTTLIFCEPSFINNSKKQGLGQNELWPLLVYHMFYNDKVYASLVIKKIIIGIVAYVIIIPTMIGLGYINVIEAGPIMPIAISLEGIHFLGGLGLGLGAVFTSLHQYYKK